MGRALPIASLVLAGLLTLPLIASQLTGGPDVNDRTWIEATREGDVLRLQGFFETDSSLAHKLHYRFHVEKRGASTSTTRQGGAFMPAGGRADTLSMVQVGVQPGDTVIARLEIDGPSGPVAVADFHDGIR